MPLLKGTNASIKKFQETAQPVLKKISNEMIKKGVEFEIHQPPSEIIEYFCNLCGKKTERVFSNLWLNVCEDCESKEIKLKL